MLSCCHSTLRCWLSLLLSGPAEGRLYRADLTALRLACVAMAILDAEPNLEHLAEARAWLVACGLTAEGPGPKPYRLRKGEPIGSYRKDSKVSIGATL